MSDAVSLLDRVRIASPCPMSWNDLQGDDKVRYCSQCKLQIYNFSAMTREQAAAIIRNNEGRLCGTFYRKADGTILTRNCPVGRRALRKKLAGFAGGIGAAIVVCAQALTGLGVGSRGTAATCEQVPPIRLRTLQPFKAISNKFDPLPTPPVRAELGEIIIDPNPLPKYTSRN